MTVYSLHIVGMIVKGIYKGILVLLALGTLMVQPGKVHASNSSLPAPENSKHIILIVSVTDDIAFTEADTDSLKRYLNKILPKHEIIHVNAFTSVVFSNIAQPHQIEEVRESIENQIKEKISTQSKISHLILMDHGNTNWGENTKSIFKFLGTFGKDGADKDFKRLFDPLIGKFTSDAFVMIEACSTVCDGAIESQNRIQALMNYFKIKNGTVFGAYQEMLSMGYEARFHIEQIVGRMKSVPFIFASLSFGLTSQASVINGGTFNITEFVLATLGTSVALPAGMKIISYIKEKSKTVNWGFLYKFKDYNVIKSYDLNPYENQKDLYLKLEPRKFKAEIFTCASLFM